MDTRTRYPLPPVVPEGSPALTDPAHSSATPACEWRTEGDFRDIRYELSTGDATGIAKITINRPQKRNAFRPQTLFELQDAFNRARDDDDLRVLHAPALDLPQQLQCGMTVAEQTGFGEAEQLKCTH